MSSLPSAEVAADFREALQDLKVNSRPEISNLTIIAKENTEHAQAISRELENHIRTARPEWKLPALYVLDSVVKNVGTPYTVYLGRNLYRTFMDAYTLMEVHTRKAMEGLLKTWKQPVPESMDTRPVFPADVTREIENALIKFRTVTLQHQQQLGRSQRQILSPGLPKVAAAQPWRDTPTPPQTGRYPSPAAIGAFPAPQYPHARPVHDPRMQQHTPQPYPSNFPQPGASGDSRAFATYPPGPTPTNDMERLLLDVDRLINQAKEDFVKNLYEPGTQQKLKALLDLQSILRNQQLPPAQLKLIQDQVAQFAVPAHQPPAPPPAVPNPSPTPTLFPTVSGSGALPNRTSTPQFSTDVLAQLLSSTVGQQLVSSTPPVPAPSHMPPAPERAPSVNLAEILAGAQPGQPQIRPTPPAPDNSLLASLRVAGLLPAAAPRTIPTTQASPAVLGQSAPMQARNDVQMNNASIRTPRPHLMSLLYEARPNRCHACARRFRATDEGRQMKQRHLDWHYTVKTRIAEGSKRGLNRDWYVNELEWIAYREQDEAAPPAEPENSRSAPKKEPVERFVRVPADVALQKVACPICHDAFVPSWRDDEWVWMDALEAGGRTYHASCYGEATKDGSAQLGRSTPPVLGKRKAEQDEAASLRAKLKRDIAV